MIKHKQIKRATKLLGFKEVKNKNACKNVVENVTTALSAFGKARKNDIRAARRAITTAIVARRTSRNRMVAIMSKLLHVSRKTLHKYAKFRVKIDENDEVVCWALICREACASALLSALWIERIERKRWLLLYCLLSIQKCFQLKIL